jgi:hypothetical protein
MGLLLHIITRPEDALAREILTRQDSNGGKKVVVADLTQPNTDYKRLLENVFAADSIQVW